MKFKYISTSLFTILCLQLIQLCNSLDFDPYAILNVKKSADKQEIRKSYKSLVKEWHPDKNKAPDAQEKFIQIQQAYEILSDDEKRSQFDRQGFTDDDAKQYQQARHHHFHPFGDMFDFDFEHQSARSISTYKFFKQVLPSSHNTPQVLYVYSTFCSQCIVILKSSWERAARDLEKLGLGVGEVDVTFAKRISSHLRVSSVPTTVVVYKERVSYYKGTVSYEGIKAFAASQLPYRYVTMVTSNTMASFLSGIENDDKPRAILFSKQTNPTLLYLLMTLKHYDYIEFGFVSWTSSDSQKIVDELHVTRKGPTLMIFKDNSNKPTVTLQSSQMPHGAVDDLLTLHRYMSVPRITSQRVFDEVCTPPHTHSSFHVRFCVILVTDYSHTNYRNIIENVRAVVGSALEVEDGLSEWLQFAHVVASKQPPFVKSLSGSETMKSGPELYLVWRKFKKHGMVSSYSASFLENKNQLDDGFQNFLTLALRTFEHHQFERNVKFLPVINELAPSIAIRVFYMAVEYSSNTLYWMSMRNEIELLILLAIFAFPLYLILGKKSKSRPSSRTQRNPQSHGQTNNSEQNSEYSSSGSEGSVDGAKENPTEEIKSVPVTRKPQARHMTELTHLTYGGQILNQQRGHLMILFLKKWNLDNDHILNGFLDVTKFHLGNSSLQVSFINLEIYMSWYIELRTTSSPQPPTSPDSGNTEDMSTLRSAGDSNFDKKPKITGSRSHGTVLVINGSKHWYCMFVPREARASTKQLSTANHANYNNLMRGNNDTQSSDSELCEDILNTDEPNDYATSLSLWLDRVLEGQMPRMYVCQWPGLYVRAVDDED